VKPLEFAFGILHLPLSIGAAQTFRHLGCQQCGLCSFEQSVLLLCESNTCFGTFESAFEVTAVAIDKREFAPGEWSRIGKQATETDGPLSYRNARLRSRRRIWMSDISGSTALGTQTYSDVGCGKS
jgi:hypothetical protein